MCLEPSLRFGAGMCRHRKGVPECEMAYKFNLPKKGPKGRALFEPLFSTPKGSIYWRARRRTEGMNGKKLK